MNSIKNLLVIAVLLGVAYAVYTTIGGNPPPNPSLGEADKWPGAIDVHLPDGPEAQPNSSRNPFASGGSKTAASVTAREPSAVAAPQFGSKDVAEHPRWSTTADSLPSRPQPDSKLSLPSESAPPWGTNGSGPSGQRVGEQAPGLAISTDMSVAPPSISPSSINQDKSGSALRSEPKLTPAEWSGPARNSATSGIRKDFASLMEDAQERLGRGEFAKVHLALSRLYGDPDLTVEETRRLTELLDQLAGTVIYSRRPLLDEPPHVVKAGETLAQIAEGYSVPWQLLAKINGIRDPNHLEPGRPIKVIRGPFEAVISLERCEMTLLVGGRYAGRFPIGLGRDLPRQEASYTVKRKILKPNDPSPDRRAESSDPGNPLGNYWIELADRVGIHGTPDARNLRRTDNTGSICLGPRDIEDVYDILTADSATSVGSKVTIRR